MSMRRSYRCALVLTCLLAAACSDVTTTAPPVDEPFAIWGILNPAADTQAVLVYPVVPGLLQPLGPDPLDATVASMDLTTGTARVWRDSVVSDGEGGYSHVFWSEFRAGYGRTYDLEVVRSDGARSSATVRVPEDVTIDVGDHGHRHMDLDFQGRGTKLIRLDLTHGVRYHEDVRTPECQTEFPIYYYTFSYDDEVAGREDGWSLPLDLGHFMQVLTSFYADDYPRGGVRAMFDGKPFAGLSLLSLHVDVTVADESWDRPGNLDDHVTTSHPGTTTNVENGFGYVNAAYRREAWLEPSKEAIRDANFGYCE